MEKGITCIFVNNQTRAAIWKNLAQFWQEKRRRTNKNLTKNDRGKEKQI